MSLAATTHQMAESPPPSGSPARPKCATWLDDYDASHTQNLQGQTLCCWGGSRHHYGSASISTYPCAVQLAGCPMPTHLLASQPGHDPAEPVLWSLRVPHTQHQSAKVTQTSHVQQAGQLGAPHA